MRFVKKIDAMRVQAGMSADQFQAQTAKIQADAHTAYLGLHKLKHEMDSWGEHQGLADLTEPQKKVYDALMKALDSWNAHFKDLEKLSNLVKTAMK